MRTLLHALVLGLSVVVMAGCSDPATRGVTAPKPGVGTAIADAGALRLNELEASANRVVSNNARAAIKALEEGDCYRTVVALTTISSSNSSKDHLEIVEVAMKEVVEVSQARASGGDENARFALDFLEGLMKQHLE